MSITEGTQPAVLQWTGAWTTNQTTASFTPESGALLVALVAGDSNANTAVTASVTDSLSGTWTLLKRQNTGTSVLGGLCEVWCRDSPGSALTVSVKNNNELSAGSTGGQLVVRTLIGAKAAASQNGATGAAGPSPGAVQVSVAAGTGNKIYGAALNYDTSTAMSALANTTVISAFSDTTNGDDWEAFKSSGDTAGTATYGYSTSLHGMIAAVEILAAPTAAAGAAAQQLIPPGLQSPMAFGLHFPPQQVPPPAPAQPVVSGPPVYPLTGPVGLGRRQPLLVPGSAAGSPGLFAQQGPPVTPLQRPAAARQPLPQRGRTSSNDGTRSQTGAPVTALRGPARARFLLPPRGRCAGNRGTFSAIAPQAGPPVYPLAGPVRTRTRPPSRGRTAGNDGLFAQAGPPVTPLRGPVCARQPLPRRGRCAGSQGTFTQVVIVTGAPVYPLHGPVRTRPQPPPRGRCAGNRGTRAQTGPPVTALRGPVAPFRPGPYRSGRCQSDPGVFAQAGPRVYPLRGPVRGRVPQRPRGGHAAGGAGTYTFIPPPPFTVGTLTASDAPAGVLAGVTASGGAGGVLTASDTRTGGPS